MLNYSVAELRINHIVEPQPPENMMDIPGMQDEMRRPMMLIVSANKKVDR